MTTPPPVNQAEQKPRASEPIVARVFPRRTKATPIDPLAFVGLPPMFLPPISRVDISVTFTADKPKAERLAKEWERIAPVRIGGPAYDDVGGDFTPGQFLKPGYVITSRGCPNCCWFCDAWRREGRVVRELPITEGRNPLDNNILACSEQHIRAVFAMLKHQKHPVEFTGGLEAARLKPWHVELLSDLKPKQLFFAYDTPDDLEPLRVAGKMLLDAGFRKTSHALRCYVLCGYEHGGIVDTMDAAETRMMQTLDAGFLPVAMLHMRANGNKKDGWGKFIRKWFRPAIVSQKLYDHPRQPQSPATRREIGEQERSGT